MADFRHVSQFTGLVWFYNTDAIDRRLPLVSLEHLPNYNESFHCEILHLRKRHRPKAGTP